MHEIFVTVDVWQSENSAFLMECKCRHADIFNKNKKKTLFLNWFHNIFEIWIRFLFCVFIIYIYRPINIFCIYIILPFIYFLTTAIFLSESNIINWPPFSEHIFSDVWRGSYSRWKEKHHIPSRINSSSLTVFLIKLTKTETN